MAPTGPAGAALSARIVYWGPQGSGKTTNLRVIHSKLRPDHRGELKRVPAPLDPTASSEVMPIELGDVGGVRTRLEVVALPGGPEHAPTRKQLLDRVDGVVFVVDAQRDRLDDNLASFDELRSSLAAYGRSLSDLPLVVQYNKRDLADPYALEELHRKLDLRGAAAFEAVASDGTGVLPTLTTISKGVVRVLRERTAASAAAAVPLPAPPAAPVAPPAAAPVAPPRVVPAPEPLATGPELEVEAEVEAAATAARAEALFEPGFARVRTAPAPAALATPAASPWSVASVGEPSVAEGGMLRVPVVLRDAEGRTLSLALSVRIDVALGTGE
jgi:signal recognition particle receptor subunit beta